MSSYITPIWPAPPSVKAFSSTRKGGHSLPPFDSLNLGTHVGDNTEHVAANRRQLIQDLALPSHPIWLNQIHGNEVAILKNTPEKILSVDGVVTQQKNLVCAIMTADCLPILLCDTAGSQVAAIHAGWRGLAAGIIFQTLRKMKQNAQHEILAWLGPAIGPEKFEIDASVREILNASLPQGGKDCFNRLKSNKEKYLADLYKIATYHLMECNVQKISGAQYCTYTESDLFFSYRRTSNTALKTGQTQTGRMATLIWLT